MIIGAEERTNNSKNDSDMTNSSKVYEGPLNECNECHKKLSEEGEGFYNLRTDVWLQRFDAAADLYGDSRSVSNRIDDDDDDNNTSDDNDGAGSYEKPTQTYQFNLCKQCYEALDRRLQQQNSK